MGVPFDHIASTYDSAFAKSTIGQLQRKRVWSYIESVISDLQGFEMLELHCGSREDDVLFGEGGFNLVATDLGSEMLKLTNKKAEQYSMQGRISSHCLDLESFDETVFDKKFDLVFSNFGGLNYINPKSLKKLLQKLPSVLNPGGRFVGVVMPKVCVWETIFFMLRFQFGKAFRRYSSKEANEFSNPPMWYYSPSEIKKWSYDQFKTVSVKPIGIALPSSYLENFFTFRKKLLLTLDKVEKRLSRTTLLASMADHYVIDLQLRY